MKHLILILLLFVIGFDASAQPTRKYPNWSPAPFVQTGQMYYTANANAYTGTYIRDTIIASASINLAIATYRKGIVATDSFSYLPIFGQAAQAIGVTYTKISGTPAVTAVNEWSWDGVKWYQQDTATFTATGTYTFKMPIRYTSYNRVAIYTTTTTQSGYITAYHNTVFPNYNATK